MTAFEVRPYRETDRRDWESVVDGSRNGTLLHRRGFLDVTSRAVEDRSVVVLERGRPVAVLPAAVHPSDPAMVDSHPTTGHGGLVRDGRTTGPRLLEALGAVAEHFYHEGFDTLRYKAVPLPYQAMPAQDDLYALFRLGAARARCELASVLEVAAAGPVAHHRQRHLRRARRSGVEVVSGAEHLTPFWTVLTERLAARHHSAPQHTLGEIQALHAAFPDHVRCVVARQQGRVVAGAVVLRIGRVDHAQYLAADDRGLRVSALDLVIEELVGSCGRTGVQFLSLGTTTADGGRALNVGLHRYKSEFGAGDIVHETYDLPLR